MAGETERAHVGRAGPWGLGLLLSAWEALSPGAAGGSPGRAVPTGPHHRARTAAAAPEPARLAEGGVAQGPPPPQSISWTQDSGNLR